MNCEISSRSAIEAFSRIVSSSSSPSSLRSSREQPDAGADEAARVAGRDPLAVDLDLPAVDGVGAEQRAQQLGPPRAEQPADPEDLALADLQVDRRVGPAHAQAGRLQQRLPGLARLAGRVQRLDLAADHGRDQRVVVEVGHRARRAHLAVAQHGDAVADLEHLLEPVADVEHRHPALAQLADQLQQRVRLVAGQRGRRLVEHDHAGVARQHLGHLDQLPGGRRERVDLRARVDVLAARRGPAAPCARSRSAPPRTSPWRDGSRPIRRFSCTDSSGSRRQLLVDDADARRAGLGGARVPELLAVDLVGARVAPDGAGEHLDDRRLARPVLAGEAVHLAGVELEVDVLDRLDRPEGLRGPVQLQQRH